VSRLLNAEEHQCDDEINELAVHDRSAIGGSTQV
jgi:hypothetical protein